MVRKFVNGSYLRARLGSSRIFWRSRYGLGWLNFRRLRAGFQLKNKASNATTEIQYWRAMSKGALVPIFLAVAVSIILYVFERNLSFFINISWVHDTVIGQYLMHTLDKGTYVQLLTAIAGVTGVFLGLYFTAVSTVISNAYSSVSGDVRELILRDRIGNNYVKLVSFLTALSVLLLAFSAANAGTAHLGIPILAIASCLAVFAFVNLGMRAFFLSDPTLFFNTVSAELLKWVKQATYRGYQWRSPSFQEHYRKQALRSATTLATLAKIASEKPELQGESYPRLLRKLLALTSVYQNDKHLIPSGSNWFSKKFQHKQWYLTESTELESATRTDTTLRPNEIPDTTWLEDVILDGVFKSYEADLANGDYQALYNKTVSLPDFFKDTAADWLHESGEIRHQRLSKYVIDELVSGKEIDNQQEPYSVAITDILASLPMSLELGFIKAVDEVDPVKLRTQLSNMRLAKENAPYHFNLPPSTIKVLEDVHAGAAFEKLSQARHKTQNWYVTELVLHDLEMSLYKQWQSLMKLLENWYAEAGEALTKAKRYKQSAAVYSRAIEQAWKLDSHIERLKNLSEALREGHRVDFIKNAEWDWDKEHSRVAKFRDAAIEGQAKLIPHLWNTRKPDPDMPDFFGGAVHYTGEACFDALVAGDGEKFKALFRPYFLGILGVFESVRSQVVEWETSSAIAWMSEPILDLFDISGYAYIFAEYHNKPELWSECKGVWDTYLSEVSQQLQSFAVISNYHQTPRMVITPRAPLRSGREIALGRMLNELPRQQTSDFFSRPQVEHQSQLIRNIAPWSDHLPSMFVDAIDVFTTRYLITLPDSSTLDFGINQDKITSINGRPEDESE